MGRKIEGMEDLTSQIVESITKKKAQVLDCIIKELGLPEMNPYARFKDYAIESSQNKESYYYNDLTEAGLFLCSMETIFDGNTLTLNVVAHNSMTSKINEILNAKT